MTEQQLNDRWAYDQQPTEAKSAAILDSEGNTMALVVSTGMDPRKSAKKMAQRIVVEHNLLEAIRLTLDGKEWDSDTCQDIADLMTAQGYQVRDVDEAEADSPFEAFEYAVCEDCLFYLANDDIPDEWAETPERYLRGIAEDIDREIGGRKGSFCVGVKQTPDDPDGTGYEGFSYNSCELCRDTKGGSRHGVTLLIEKESP